MKAKCISNEKRWPLTVDKVYDIEYHVCSNKWVFCFNDNSMLCSYDIAQFEVLPAEQQPYEWMTRREPQGKDTSEIPLDVLATEELRKRIPSLSFDDLLILACTT